MRKKIHIVPETSMATFARKNDPPIMPDSCICNIEIHKENERLFKMLEKVDQIISYPGLATLFLNFFTEGFKQGAKHARKKNHQQP